MGWLICVHKLSKLGPIYKEVYPVDGSKLAQVYKQNFTTTIPGSTLLPAVAKHEQLPWN